MHRQVKRLGSTFCSGLKRDSCRADNYAVSDRITPLTMTVRDPRQAGRRAPVLHRGRCRTYAKPPAFRPVTPQVMRHHELGCPRWIRSVRQLTDGAQYEFARPEVGPVVDPTTDDRDHPSAQHLRGSVRAIITCGEPVVGPATGGFSEPTPPSAPLPAPYPKAPRLALIATPVVGPTTAAITASPPCSARS